MERHVDDFVDVCVVGEVVSAVRGEKGLLSGRGVAVVVFGEAWISVGGESPAGGAAILSAGHSAPAACYTAHAVALPERGGVAELAGTDDKADEKDSKIHQAGKAQRGDDHVYCQQEWAYILVYLECFRTSDGRFFTRYIFVEIRAR